ncbi:MAG: glycosyltransferase family 4 protein [Patescibacteria group bacterium]
MKICYLNHDLKNNTGAGRFARALLAEVKKIMPDIEHSILVSERSGEPYEAPILYPNKIKLFLALPKIRKVFKQCDVIHALDGWPYGVIAALASIGLKKKLVITAIGTGAIRPLYNFWKRPLMKWAYKKADAVTAISYNTEKEILKIIPDLKIKVINHGVDFDKFQQIFDNSHKFLNLRPYILSVGAWKPRKGFEYSIKAFEQVKDKFPNLKYVILSNVPEEIKIQDPRIIFINNISEEELINLYKNAELFILLPQDDGKDIEGFGLVFLEAAACGLPVIATKETSAEDAVLNNKNGILVPPKDYKEAANAIFKILSDLSLKQSFSEESLKFAKEMSWQKAAKSYTLLYK